MYIVDRIHSKAYGQGVWMDKTSSIECIDAFLLLFVCVKSVIKGDRLCLRVFAMDSLLLA